MARSSARLSGWDNSAMRAIPRRQRLVEVWCDAVPARGHRPPGQLLAIIRRDGSAQMPPGQAGGAGYGDGATFLAWCRCEVLHDVTLPGMLAARQAGERAKSSRHPIRIEVADLNR